MDEKEEQQLRRIAGNVAKALAWEPQEIGSK